MKIDLAELYQAKSHLDASVKQIIEGTGVSALVLRQILQTSSFQGKVKEAINEKISNHQIPLLLNYATVARTLAVDYVTMIVTFKETVGETDDVAVIDTGALDRLNAAIPSIKESITSIHRSANHACAWVSDLVELERPALDNLVNPLEDAKTTLSDVKAKMEAFNAVKTPSTYDDLLSKQNSQLTSLNNLQGLAYTSKEAKKFYKKKDFSEQALKYAKLEHTYDYRLALQKDLGKELASSKYSGRVAKTAESQKYSQKELKDLMRKAGEGDSQAIQKLASFSADYQDAIGSGRQLSQKELDKQNQEVWARFEESAINLAGEVFAVYDIYRVVTGKDPVTGKDANRLEALFWLALDIIPVKKVAKLVKGANKTLKGAEALDTLSDASKVAETFEDTGRIPKGTYLGDLMSPEEAARYSDYWKSKGIGSDETWKAFKEANPRGTFEDYQRILSGKDADYIISKNWQFKPQFYNLTPKEIQEMTLDELREYPLPEGWSFHENGPFVHIKEGNKARVRIDPPDVGSNYDHMHIYDENGKSLDIIGNIVDRRSPEAHLPWNKR